MGPEHVRSFYLIDRTNKLFESLLARPQSTHNLLIVILILVRPHSTTSNI